MYMANASAKTIETVSNESPNVKSFSEFVTIINGCKKLSCSSISLFFANLMEIAAESATSSANSDNAQTIKDIFDMYISSIDFDLLKNDIESASKDLSLVPFPSGKSEVTDQWENDNERPSDRI